MATKKRKLPALDIGADVLDKITLLLVSLQSVAAVKEACTSKLGLDATAADLAIQHAREKIRAASEVDRDAARGQALIRLADLYERSLKVQDCKSALACQKEIDKLLGLHAPVRRAPSADAGDEAIPSGLAGIMAGRMNGKQA